MGTLRELEERAAREYISPAFLTWGFAELGEMEKARVWLAAAFAERSSILSWARLPTFRRLLEEPAMADLLRLRGTATPGAGSPPTASSDR